MKRIVVIGCIFRWVTEEVKVEPINKTYCVLSEVIPAESERKPVKEPPTTKNVISKFLPKAVLEYRQKGEFREVVSVFISFKEPSTFNGLDRFAAKVLETGDNFGGYFEGLNFGDKGGNCLVVFGAPVSYENSIERAINFIDELRTEYRNIIRAGVTFGTVFAGIKGSKRRAIYGVIGDVVNLSARFCDQGVFQGAQPGRASRPVD